MILVIIIIILIIYYIYDNSKCECVNGCHCNKYCSCGCNLDKPVEKLVNNDLIYQNNDVRRLFGLNPNGVYPGGNFISNHW